MNSKPKQASFSFLITLKKLLIDKTSMKTVPDMYLNLSNALLKVINIVVAVTVV